MDAESHRISLLASKACLFPRVMLMLAVLGCARPGGMERLPVQLVTGRLTVGGEPASGARVTLHPMSPEVQQRGLYPYGVVDKTGMFLLTSYEQGDGAPAGEYRVTVIWPDPSYVPKSPLEAEEIRMGGQWPDRLKGKYAKPDQSGLTLKVDKTAGEQLLPSLELP